MRVAAGLLALGVAVTVSACTGAPTPPHTASPSTAAAQPLQWRSVDLGGMTPSTLLVADGRLWIAGFTGSGADRAPALSSAAVGAPDSSTRLRATVTGQSPYAKLADVFSLAADGNQLIGIGVAHGGAHANPRWSTWALTSEGPSAPKGPQLQEQPQLFWTFGGEEAGGLIGAAWDADGPMIVGTWQGRSGLDGAIWRRTGTTWAQVAPPSVLVNSSTRQVSPVRVDQIGAGQVVVSGSVLDLTDGVRQEAATWTDSGGQWTLKVLPQPGRRSQAWATACESDCSTVGFRDGRVTIWQGTRGPDALPVTVAATDTGVVTRSGGSTLAAVSSGSAGRLVAGSAGTWRVLRSPARTPLSITVVDGTIYLIAGAGDTMRLYTAPVDEALSTAD